VRGTFLPFKVIDDVVYFTRPWFYSPFKGEKDGMPRINQSNIQMIIERDFRILKEKWHILLKENDMFFQNLPNIVIYILKQHDLCILEAHKFDTNWAKDAIKK
jgi:hypothetical protein